MLASRAQKRLLILFAGDQTFTLASENEIPRKFVFNEVVGRSANYVL